MAYVSSDAAKRLYEKANQQFQNYFWTFALNHEHNHALLKDELANLLTTISIYGQLKSWDKYCELVLATRFLLQDLGYWGEYRKLLELIFDDTQEVFQLLNDNKVYLQLLDDYASLLHTQGEKFKAIELYEEVVEQANQKQISGVLAFAHFGLGNIHFSEDNLEEAQDHWDIANQYAEKEGQDGFSVITDFLLSHRKNQIGGSGISVEPVGNKTFPKMKLWKRYIEGQFRAIHLMSMEKYSDAEEKYQDVSELAQQFEDVDGLSIALYHLGEIARITGQLDQAFAHFKESEKLALQMENHIGLASIYKGLGRLYFFQNRFDLARPYLEECVRLEREFGEGEALADALYLLGFSAANTNDLKYGEICLQQAKSIYAIKNPTEIPGVDDALERLNKVRENMQ